MFRAGVPAVRTLDGPRVSWCTGCENTGRGHVFRASAPAVRALDRAVCVVVVVPAVRTLDGAVCVALTTQSVVYLCQTVAEFCAIDWSSDPLVCLVDL